MKQDEGFNAATETYEDLVKAGVIDPAKVVRSALQNASSIASLLLTTEALISEIPEAKPGAAWRRAVPAETWVRCPRRQARLEAVWRRFIDHRRQRRVVEGQAGDAP